MNTIWKEHHIDKTIFGTNVRSICPSIIMEGWSWSITGLTLTDRQQFTLTFTPMANLESPINPTCMSLDCGKKPEYPEKTYTSTGVWPRGVERRTLFLWGDSANHCTTKLPRSICVILQTNKCVLYHNIKGHSWFEIFGRSREADGVRWCDNLDTSQLCLHHFITCAKIYALAYKTHTH